MLKASSLIIALLLSVNLLAQKTPSLKDLERSGTENLARGNYESAIADFTKMIEQTSRLETNGRLNSKFSEEAGSQDQASRDRITVIDPRTAPALVNRGRAY